jgi:hypothetical protein
MNTIFLHYMYATEHIFVWQETFFPILILEDTVLQIFHICVYSTTVVLFSW